MSCFFLSIGAWLVLVGRDEKWVPLKTPAWEATYDQAWEKSRRYWTDWSREYETWSDVGHILRNTTTIENVWPKETSLTVLSHGTICFSAFYRLKFCWIFSLVSFERERIRQNPTPCNKVIRQFRHVYNPVFYSMRMDRPRENLLDQHDQIRFNQRLNTTATEGKTSLKSMKWARAVLNWHPC